MALARTKRERAYVELCAHEMHPDLFADVPLSDEAVILQKRYKVDAQLADLRRIILHDDIELGYTPISTTMDCTVHNYTEEFKDTEYIDEPSTRTKMFKAVRALRSLGGHHMKKDYNDYNFIVTIDFDSGLQFTLQSSRAAVCKKKIVGTKYIEAKYFPARTEDVVEWECEPISLLRGE